MPILQRFLILLNATGALLLACVTLLPARAQELRITPPDVGPPVSGAAAELYRPAGQDPFPAIVLLHGCNGVGRHDREWARGLAEWGYVALLIDSFRPRGFSEVCNRGMLVPGALQGADGFAGAQYLRSQAFVRPDRVGVIGFSHGGWAVLKAVLAGSPRPAGAPPFAAAVAFYPACPPPAAPLETDTLILIGEADDWTPVERCRRWRELAQTDGHALQLKTYPGALHAFDAPRPPHQFAGHVIGRDPAAAEDAIAETRAFFASRLMRP
jgi:dienelactone hydrolase